MKKYHVYGIGAALVDTEVEVNNSDLSALGVDKGLMTLVDQARQDELLQHLQQAAQYAKRACGGSAGNTVTAINHFGAATFFSGKVADDDDGQFYLREMHSAGVETSSTSIEPGTTGKCLILITPDAERSMNTYLGISEQLSVRELDPQAIAASHCLYLEGYLVTSDSGRAAAVRSREIAAENGTQIAISFSDPGIVAHFGDGLREIIGERVDWVFCNEEEALSFAGGDNLDNAIAQIKTVAREFVITRGARGALICDEENILQVSGVPTDAIDSNGAGDMFAGAFLYGIHHGMTRQRAGNFAAAAAAQVVSQYGPRLNREQCQSLLADFQ